MSFQEQARQADASMDSPFLPFAEGTTSKDSWLILILRKELMEINMLLPNFQPSDCLLTATGEYLCRATNVLAQLSHRMTNGDHVNTCTRLKVNQMNKQTDLSELGLLDGLTSKHKSLKFSVLSLIQRVLLTSVRKLVEKLECADQDISLAWREHTVASDTTARSNTNARKFTTQFSSVDTGALIMGSSAEIPANPFTEPSSYVQSITEALDHNERFLIVVESMDAIVERLLKEMNYPGRGSHYCPYELACIKGGVSADGSLVPFERNSAFKYILNARSHCIMSN